MDLFALKVQSGDHKPENTRYLILRSTEALWTVWPSIEMVELQSPEQRLDLKRCSVDIQHHPYYRSHKRWSVTWLDRRKHPHWKERRVIHRYATQERAWAAACRWLDRFEATRRLTGQIVAVSDWHRWKMPSGGDF